MVFMECKNENDAFKLGLVYFAEVVLIGTNTNVAMNPDYLYLVENMYRFNNFS